MGRNIREYWSILRLIGILKFMMNFHSRWEVMLSGPRYINSVIGTRLIRNAILTACVMAVGEFGKFFDMSGSRMGMRMIVNVRRIEVLRSRAGSTTFTWICTKMNGS